MATAAVIRLDASTECIGPPTIASPKKEPSYEKIGALAAEAVSGAIVAGTARSLLAGLLGSVGMLVLAILLAVTVIGLLLIPVQVLLIAGGGILGITALTHYLGRLLPLPPGRRTMVLELAAGTLIFSIVAEIPVVGAMVWVATWFLAFGAVVRTRFGQPPAVLPTTPVPPAPPAPA